MKTKLKQCVNLIKASKNIVVLTGAGMSTESGIPDFRSETGIYNMIPEKVLSYQYFFSYPKEFYDFIKRIFALSDVLPNDGHKVLAKWEEEGLIKYVITQNVDALHQKAGNKNVLEVHGTMETATCQNPECAKTFDLQKLLETQGDNYHCGCKSKHGLIKPDVVLFDEPVDKINDACGIVRDADLLIILGSSLNVYPVASLPLFLKDGTPMIIINYTPTQYDDKKGCIALHEPIGETLLAIDEELNKPEDEEIEDKTEADN